MKTYINFLTLIAAGLVLTVVQSCDLHENLLDTITPANITTEADVATIVKGTYGFLDDGKGFKTDLGIMLLLSADDMYSNGDGTYDVFSQKNYNASLTSGPMTYFYSIIRGSNEVISNLDRLELSPAFEKQAYGDAYFLRAFANFYLVRLYGGIPIRTEALDIQSDYYKKRNTVDEMYAQIFDDFKKASLALPELVSSDNLGMASKGAAQALLAKAYLTYGNYQESNGQSAMENYTQASLYADSVINSGKYTLLPNFANLFNVEKEIDAYQEVIFGVRFTAYLNYGSEFAFRMGAKNVSGLSGSGSGTGSASMMVQPYIADYFKKGDYKDDYRSEYTYLNGGINPATGKDITCYPYIPTATGGNNRGCFNGKYKDPNGASQNSNGNDFFVIRLAEVYLIKAEALNELSVSPTQEALNAFNELRKRARLAAGVSRTTPANLMLGGTLTKAAFRLKIFDEREAEFAGEGQRWFDLVRMQSPEGYPKTMFDYQFALLKTQPLVSDVAPLAPQWNTTTLKWQRGGCVYGPSLAVSEKHKLFPIPDEERVLNPNFGSQNPGW